ncbi:MAG: hypothetical protein K2N11_00740 [Mucispirillum sp.]|nr:hypothetical protein [Mucispirillum sp.]
MKKIFITVIILYAFNLSAAPKIDYSKAYYVSSTAATEQVAVFGSFDGNIRLIDVKTSDIALLDNAHKKPVISMSVSYDGRYLVSAGQDDVIIFWDIESYKEIKRIIKPGMGVRAVALSPKADKLYIAYPAIIYEYDTKNWVNTGLYEGYKNGIYSIAVNSSGKILAAGSKNGDIYITDLEKREITDTYRAGSQLIMSLDFAVDKDILISGGYDNTVRIYNIGKIMPVKEFSLFKDAVKSVKISNDGTRAAIGSSDGTAVIYNILSGQVISQTISESGEITSLSAPKSLNFTAYGKGTAFQEERYGVISYPSKKGIYRKLYSFQGSDIIISEKGYINGRGGFGEYISSYNSGNKETMSEIMENYFRQDRLKVTLP